MNFISVISLLLQIPGKPGAKQRPRFNRSTGRAFTPEATANYENLIKTLFLEKYPSYEPTDDPVNLNVVAVYEIPKSWSKKKKIAAAEHKIFPGRPDIDNILKVCQDGLNNVAYLDDAQIKKATVSKVYGDRPGVTILIEIERRGEE